jgi:hypothetical protein
MRVNAVLNMGKKFLIILFALLVLFAPVALSLADDTSTTTVSEISGTVNTVVNSIGTGLSALPFSYGAILQIDAGKVQELNNYILHHWTNEKKPALNIGASCGYATDNLIAPGFVYKANTVLTWAWSWVKEKTGLVFDPFDRALVNTDIYFGAAATYSFEDSKWDGGPFVTTKF